MWRCLLLVLLLAAVAVESGKRNKKNKPPKIRKPRCKGPDTTRCAFKNRLDLHLTRLDTQRGRLDTQRARLDTQRGRLDLQRERLDNLTARLHYNTGRLDLHETRLDTQKGRLNTQRARLNNHAARLYKLEFARVDPDYVLVFRATAGIGQSVYDAYTNVNYNDDTDLARLLMPCGCRAASGACDRHYRSSLLDSWPSDKIERVRLSWYEDGVRMAYVDFDGAGSDYLNWMSQGKVLASSWTDLDTEPSNFFSVEGHAKPNRRFFMNRNYGGCPNDAGWAVVNDVVDPCDWGKNLQYPALQYSMRSTYTNYNVDSNVGQADVMTVSIKLREPDC